MVNWTDVFMESDLEWLAKRNRHVVWTTFRNGSSDAHEFGSMVEAYAYAQNNVCYSNGQVQMVHLNYPGGQRVLYHHDWSAISNAEALQMPD